MSQREYQWYVEPFGYDTNSAIARLLEATEEDKRRIRSNECEDGKPHMVYTCSSEQRRIIEKSIKSVGLDVQVWVQQGQGKIRKWNPRQIRKKSMENKKARRADRMLF